MNEDSDDARRNGAAPSQSAQSLPSNRANCIRMLVRV